MGGNASFGLLTFDVEDWEHANFAQLSGARERIASDVRARKYRMDANTDRWISLLGAAGAKSTCFVLGEFARRYPEAVKRLSDAGHEIASHGATHDLVYEMEQARFRDFLRRGLEEVADVTGKAPHGFRAPSWSVDSRRTPWLCEELEAQGLRYDSSLFPVRTPLFGQGDSPLRPYWEGRVLRIPVSVLSIAGFRLPFSSGAFFRLAPLPLIRFGLARSASRSEPVMIVLHPRELDPEHPRLPLGGWESRVHYARLSTTVPKLESLLPLYRWPTISEAFSGTLAGAPSD